jgi:hypothetical protein
MRLKLSLTEDVPTVKPYFEDKWALLADSTAADIHASVKILEGLHERWTMLLKSLTVSELKREFNHPEHNRQISIEANTGLYAWHSNHHLEHIKLALKQRGDFNE